MSQEAFEKDGWWIRVDIRLLRSLKVRQVARMLGISVVLFRGHILTLWSWTAEQTVDGVLRKMDASDIAWAAEYEGKADEFLEALIIAELVDRDGDPNTGVCRVHNWHKFQPKKSTDRTRAFRERERNKPSQGSSGEGSESGTQGNAQPEFRERSGNASGTPGNALRYDTERNDTTREEKSANSSFAKSRKSRAVSAEESEHPLTGDMIREYQARRQELSGKPWSETVSDRRAISALLDKHGHETVSRAIRANFEAFGRKANGKILMKHFFADFEQLSIATLGPAQGGLSFREEANQRANESATTRRELERRLMQRGKELDRGRPDAD